MLQDNKIELDLNSKQVSVSQSLDDLPNLGEFENGPKLRRVKNPYSNGKSDQLS
jgi:hypothetical protein